MKPQETYMVLAVCLKTALKDLAPSNTENPGQRAPSQLGLADQPEPSSLCVDWPATQSPALIAMARQTELYFP